VVAGRLFDCRVPFVEAGNRRIIPLFLRQALAFSFSKYLMNQEACCSPFSGGVVSLIVCDFFVLLFIITAGTGKEYQEQNESNDAAAIQRFLLTLDHEINVELHYLGPPIN